MSTARPYDPKQIMRLFDRAAASLEDLAANGGWIRVRCPDGFRISVIAHGGAYCTPRPGWIDDGSPPSDYSGPFTHLEVGFPSSRPEPWDVWEQYCEDPEKPTDTVYGYVPVDTIRDLIQLHGGEA